MRFDDEINFDNYDKERLREQIQNPLFRAANKKLCLAFEQYEAEEQAVGLFILFSSFFSSFFKLLLLEQPTLSKPTHITGVTI